MADHAQWHVFSVYAQHEVRTPTGTLVAVANSREDARLISAAPDLQEQLQRVMDALGGECFDWAPVRAALAKAGSPS